MSYIDFHYFNDLFNTVYSDKADFNTNAKSYYDALARNKEFLKLFTETIIKLHNELQKDFDEYKLEMNEDFKDLKDMTESELALFSDRLDNIKQEMIVFFNQWLADGTLDEIINQDILNRVPKFNVPRNYGAVADGITDDTDAIQRCLDAGGNIYFEPGEYYFKKVFVRKDDTSIHFADNVVLKSDDMSDSLQSGAFVIEGETKEVVGINQSLTIGSNKIGVTDVSLFKVGDLIQIIQDRPVLVSTIEQHKQMYSYSLVTIKEIDTSTNTLTLYEDLEHDFDIVNNPKAVLIKPVKNVRLLGNNTLFDKMGTTQYSSHFYVNYASNITISGFEVINGGGKAVSMYNTHTFEVSHITHKKPTNIEAGHGYNIFINRSCYGLVDKTYSYGSRHAVDISTSSYMITTKHSYGYGAPFTSHGSNSQFFTFEDCHVFNSAFVIGNYSFMTDNNVSFMDCSSNGGDYGISISSGVYNVDITDFTSKNNSTGLTILPGSDNINVVNYRSENDNFGADIRSKHVTIVNMNILNPKTYGLMLTNAEHINLSHITLVNTKDQITTGLRLVGTSKEIFVSDLYMRGKFSRAVLLMDNASKLTIESSDIVCESIRLIDDASTIGTATDLTLINNRRLENTLPDSLVLLSPNPKMSLKNNSKINNGITLNGTTDISLIGNEFNGQIGVASATNKLIAVNNYGTGSFMNAPASNGTTILIANNLNPLLTS